jgi:hypothetical protein
VQVQKYLRLQRHYRIVRGCLGVHVTYRTGRT